MGFLFALGGWIHSEGGNMEWTYRVEKGQVILYRGTLIVILLPEELYSFGRIIQNASFDWCKLTGKNLDENKCKSGVKDDKSCG